jgi:OOP family OmpA-OmpF porin
MGLAGFALVVILFVFLVPYYASRIEADVYERTTKEFQAAMLPVTGLVVEGRDVYLTGPVSSEALRIQAERTALGVQGVRTVRNFLVAQDTFQRTGRLKEIQRRIEEITRERGVEFEPGAAVITQSGKAVLDKVGEVLAADTDVAVEVQGHTEWLGSQRKSQALSQQRAGAAARYLVSKGIGSDRVSAAGFGADNPIGPNSTEEGRARNRRIEFFVR